MWIKESVTEDQLSFWWSRQVALLWFISQSSAFPPLLFISTEASQNKFLCRGIIFLFFFLFFTFWRDCRYSAKAPLCHFCIILVHGWLLPFLSFLFPPPHEESLSWRCFFVVAGRHFLTPISKTRVQSMSSSLGFFAVQWHPMISCQPSSQDCSESSSQGNSGIY